MSAAFQCDGCKRFMQGQPPYHVELRRINTNHLALTGAQAKDADLCDDCGRAISSAIGHLADRPMAVAQ